MNKRTRHHFGLMIALGIVISASIFSLAETLVAPQTPSAELLPETPVDGSFTADKKGLFKFGMGANRFFRIIVHDSGTEVSLVINGPGRNNIRSTVCRRDAVEISGIARTAGEYHVEISQCGELDTKYQVTLSSVRPPTELDRTRVTAEQMAEDADQLIRETPRQHSTALAKYEGALKVWSAIGDRFEEVRTLRSAANLLRDSGNTVKALAYAERALQLADTERLQSDRAELLRGIATIHLRNGNAAQALDYCSKALEVSRSHSDRNGVAEGLLVIGDVYYFAGEFGKADDAYNEALAIWKGLQYKRGQAQSLMYLAGINGERYEFTQAYDRIQLARSLFDSVADQVGKAKASVALGHILSDTGRKQEALDLFETARSVLVGSGDLMAENTVLNSVARTYAELGDFESALPFSKLALENYATLGNKVAESFVLEATGLYYLGAGDFNNARLLLQRALRGFEGLANTRAEADSWLALGTVQQSLGDPKAAFADLNRSLELSRVSGDRGRQASALLALGRLREDTGDNAAALEFYQESLVLYRAIDDRFGEIATLYHMAKCLRRTGDIERSIANSELAIDSIEKLRTGLTSFGLRSQYFASTRQHFDVYIDSLMHANPVSSAKAFEFSERARARTLLDSIGEAQISISESIDPDLVKRETSLAAAIDGKSEQYTQLLSASPNSKELAGLSDELRRLNAEFDELQGQLRTRSSQYAGLVQPQLLKLTEIQNQLLDDRSLLLEYSLGDENSYLWAVTREDFGSYVLPRRTEIDKKVRRLRDLMTAPAPLSGEKPADFQTRFKAAQAQYPEVAAELSRILFGPVADRLDERRLIIVAEGALQYLPFGALPTPQSIRNSSFTPLIVEHEIVNLPSASTLALIRREAPRRGNPDRTIAVFADPVFQASDSRVRKPAARVPSTPQTNPARGAGRTAPTASLAQALRGSDAVGIKIDLPRLTATRQEADAILAMVPEDRRMAALGFNATKAAAMNPDLQRYRIVHFATHTILNDDHPDLSSLVLSLVDEKGNPQSGFLRLRDMYNLHLAAELVVLSACDTALGKEVKGEGLMSMVRGFMYSGTPRVLASLWKVDDEATAELMKEFYKNLLQSGLTPAAALRQAQITQMQKKSRQSPYYWAGFQLQGEWN